MKNNIFVVLVLALLLILNPVSAAYLPFYVESSTDKGFYNVQSLSYDARNESMAIGGVWFYIQQDTVLTYTLHFHDGSTKSGTITYTPVNYGIQYYMALNLDGSVDSITGTHIPYSTATVQLGYYVENETDFKLGISNKNLDIFIVKPTVYIDIDDPASNPIYTIDIISNGNPFDAKIQCADIDTIANAQIQHESGGNDILAFITNTFSSIYEIVTLIWSFFKFFFVDNLFLTIILVEGGILAYRLTTSPDIFRALSYIITDNERLLRGLIEFIGLVASLAWDLINMLNPMRWLRGG